MNSAPISITAPFGSTRDHVRPPTRSRASSTSTSAPPRASSSAAASPASPAPMTTTRRLKSAKHEAVLGVPAEPDALAELPAVVGAWRGTFLLERDDPRAVAELDDRIWVVVPR